MFIVTFIFSYSFVFTCRRACGGGESRAGEATHSGAEAD
jgi:hypothetical protein